MKMDKTMTLTYWDQGERLGPLWLVVKESQLEKEDFSVLTPEILDKILEQAKVPTFKKRQEQAKARGDWAVQASLDRQQAAILDVLTREAEVEEGGQPMESEELETALERIMYPPDPAIWDETL